MAEKLKKIHTIAERRAEKEEPEVKKDEPAEPAAPAEAPAVPDLKPEEKKEEKKPRYNGAANLRKYNEDTKNGVRKRVKPFEKARAREAAKHASEAAASGKNAVGASVNDDNGRVKKVVDNVDDARTLGHEPVYEEKNEERKKKSFEIDPKYLYIGIGALGFIGAIYAVMKFASRAKAPTVIVKEVPVVQKPKVREFDIGGGRVITVPIQDEPSA